MLRKFISWTLFVNLASKLNNLLSGLTKLKFPEFVLLPPPFLVTPKLYPKSPQWGAADAEIKVPSGEDIELKRSPFKAWSRSVCSHKCYAFCKEFLPSSPFTRFFSKTSPDFFPALAVANTGSCVGPQNKIGHPARCRFPLLNARGI